MSKKMKLKVSASVLAVAGLAMQSGSANAAGFEKSLSWSAASAAQGGAVVGSVKGADSLYFNPAGLASASGTAAEVSFNLSPTFSKFKGANPLQNAGTVDGKSGFSPVGGLLASYRVNNQLGLGFGYYVSGGTKSTYENLDYSTSSGAALFAAGNIRPLVETSLAITELSLGAGYEVLPGFRLGASWRPTMVKADFSTVTGGVQGGQPYVGNLHINNIAKSRWNGYRLGAQYEAADNSWGLGASYRSEVSFTAEGDQTGEFSSALGAGMSTALQKANTGKASISNIFPQQVNMGGFVKASDALKVSLEYSFTNYSKNKGLTIVGPAATSTIVQNWKNQHIGRLGFEYTGYSMPIRFGYAITSQVTPSDRARSTFASPGKGHAIALGSGMPLMTNLDMDFAAEYSFASGVGKNPPEVVNDADFQSNALVAHLSAKYHF